MPKKILYITLIALALGLGFVSAQHFWLKPTPITIKPVLETARTIDTPRALPNFTLQSNNGPLTAQELKGHWTLIFIGFTRCSDVCPTTLSTLAKTQTLLRQAQLTNTPKVLFVSIDPERDTPQHLAEYTHFFHPDTLSATSSEPQLTEFTHALGLVYMKVPNATDYSMDHSASLVLLNPKAEFAGLIRPPLKPDAIARDLITLAKTMP